jgi:hypothetical protein
MWELETKSIIPMFDQLIKTASKMDGYQESRSAWHLALNSRSSISG